MNDKQAGSPLTVIIVAVVALVVLSMLPWDDLSGHRLKSFNLLSDLVPQSDKTYITHENIDPELAALTVSPTDSVSADTAGIAADNVAYVALPDDFSAPVDAAGNVLVEDYSGHGLADLSQRLASSSSRRVRIAVIGDSYIEGDIFTQDIRARLQDIYGGRGVGYMAAHSNFPGFRQSVRQQSSGWTERDMRHIGSDPIKPLSGVYYRADGPAEVTYKGSSRPAHADGWSRSTVLFIAPAGGSITLDTPAGQVTHAVSASPDVQAVSCEGETDRLTVKSDIAGLKMLGAWLETPTGIVLDCMSMRGNSGITHRKIDAGTARQMRGWIDYDLIIFQYGINALSSEQRDYSTYASVMAGAVEHVRELYPEAVIMIMGIGDRGQKQGTDVHSLSTAPAMVRAQRDIARRTGSLFWDTRAAMGGDDASVDWHRRKLVNADYIHLNHKGGAALAEIFVNSLQSSLHE